MPESGVDARFYEGLGPIRLADLAERIGAELADPQSADRMIAEAAPLARATASAITFFQDKRYLPGFETTKAAACVVGVDDADRVIAAGVAPLVAAKVQTAFAKAVRALHRPIEPLATEHRIDPTARIDPSAQISATACIGAGAVIGPHVSIAPGGVVGPGVTLGEGVRLGPNACVMFCDIGPRTVIQAGGVVGDMGFGAHYEGSAPSLMPHIGRVQIGADVNIGVNSSVDRGMFDDTVLDDGVKIDNLVQIAHNVRIGRGSVIAGCCGLSGSVVLGERVILGGSVGIADHIHIGDDAQLAGATLVMRNVPAGETWAGTPARPIKAFFREFAALQRLARRPKSER